MRLLTILGQKIDYTGSGILVKEIINRAEKFGDEHYLLTLDYKQNYDTDNLTIPNRTIVWASLNGEKADLNHRITGMSDVMPYPSIALNDNYVYSRPSG